MPAFVSICQHCQHLDVGGVPMAEGLCRRGPAVYRADIMNKLAAEEGGVVGKQGGDVQMVPPPGAGGERAIVAPKV